MKKIDNNSIVCQDIDSIAGSFLPWNELFQKVVLITGGGGFIGSYLVRTLLHVNQVMKLGLTVICVTRNKSSLKGRLDVCNSFSELIIFEQELMQPMSCFMLYSNI